MGVNESIGCRRGGEAWPQPLFLSRSRGKDPPPRGNRPCAPFAFLQSMRLPRRVEDAAELRKNLKPLLEKRRRARINESLSQLKGLVLPLLGAETSRSSKLEKADILEMTVRFLQEQPATLYSSAAPGPLNSYLEGYRACLARLARVLPACSVLEPAVSARLLEHLRQRTVSDDSPSLTLPPAPAPAPSPPVPPPGSSGLWRPW